MKYTSNIIIQCYLLLIILLSLLSCYFAQSVITTSTTTSTSSSKTLTNSEITCDSIKKRFKVLENLGEQTYNEIKKVSFTNERFPKINLFDVFALTNEVDTLIIRLHELAHIVTKFIIVEPTATFSGLPRNLTYPSIQNKKRIRKYENQILYVPCDYPLELNITKNMKGKEKAIWQREHYLRDICMKEAIMKANVSSQDMMIIGDIDEIPSLNAMLTLMHCSKVNNQIFDHEIRDLVMTNNKKLKTPEPTVIVFITNRLHFNFHCRSSNMGNWKGPCIVFGSALDKMSISDIREARAMKHKTLLYIGAGWHLSNFYYQDLDLLVDKYRGFSHQEVTKKIPNTIEYWEKVVKKKGNLETNTHCEELDLLDLPIYVYKNMPYFKHLLNEKQLNFGNQLMKVN